MTVKIGMIVLTPITELNAEQEGSMLRGLDILGGAACAGAVMKGFWGDAPYNAPFNFAEKLALIHSEISECLEAHRKSLVSDHLPDRPGVEEELADAVIRIFDLAEKTNLDLPGAIADKLRFNLTRPHKHGKDY